MLPFVLRSLRKRSSSSNAHVCGGSAAGSHGPSERAAPGHELVRCAPRGDAARENLETVCLVAWRHATTRRWKVPPRHPATPLSTSPALTRAYVTARAMRDAPPREGLPTRVTRSSPCPSLNMPRCRIDSDPDRPDRRVLARVLAGPTDGLPGTNMPTYNANLGRWLPDHNPRTPHWATPLVCGCLGCRIFGMGGDARARTKPLVNTNERA